MLHSVDTQLKYFSQNITEQDDWIGWLDVRKPTFVVFQTCFNRG
jgi:hypothetical protein